jgi:hypothetical protein
MDDFVLTSNALLAGLKWPTNSHHQDAGLNISLSNPENGSPLSHLKY